MYFLEMVEKKRFTEVLWNFYKFVSQSALVNATV